MRPYLIVTPNYFPHCTNGIKVMHRLSYLLNTKEQSSYVACVDIDPMFPSLRLIPPAPNPDGTYPLIGKIRDVVQDGIVVYHGLLGDIFKAKHPVWYLLGHHPQFEGRNIFVHNGALLKSSIGIDRLLYISTIELNLFNLENIATRKYTTIWIGKGQVNQEFINSLPKDGLFLIKASLPATRKEVADLFKQSKVLYSFDSLSQVNSEARLCGCPVVFVPNIKANVAQLKNMCDGINGVALNTTPGEIKRAVDTVHLYPKDYMESIKDCDKMLDNFIQVSQELAK